MPRPSIFALCETPSFFCRFKAIWPLLNVICSPFFLVSLKKIQPLPSVVSYKRIYKKSLSKTSVHPGNDLSVSKVCLELMQSGKILLVAVLCSWSVFAQAQTHGSIRGTIAANAGEPGIGLTVKVLDTHRGSASDHTGAFVIYIMLSREAIRRSSPE